MNASVYYHILEIGVIFTKGNKRGRLWRLRERKRLSDECALWRKLILSAMEETGGRNCPEEVRRDIQRFCDQYHNPAYERVLGLWDRLIKEDNRFVPEKDKAEHLCSLMRNSIDEIERSIKRFWGKDDAYRSMVRLHNLPKALHGKDLLGGGAPISYEDAIRYYSSGGIRE